MPAEETQSTPRRGDRPRARTQRAIDNDEAERLRATLRETKRRKSNIQAQQAANALAAVEEEGEEGSDDAPPPPPASKPSKSTTSGDKGKRRVSPLPIPARKPTKPTQGGSRTTTTAGGEAARLKLVTEIAAHDQRTDHTDFSLEDLRLIWVNGDRVRDKERSSDGKMLFSGSDLKALGTMDAEDETSRASLGKGKPAGRKSSSSTKVSRLSNGDRNVKSAATSNRDASRVSSTSTTRPRSTSPATMSRGHSSSVALKRKTSGGRRASGSAPTTSDADDVRESDSDDSPDDDEELVEIGDTEGEEPNRKGKPKMTDYSGDDVDILDAVVEGVAAHLLATGWFLDSHDYDCLILYTWRKKAGKVTSRPHKHPLTIRKMRLIKYRVTSYQGRLKLAIKAAGLIQYYKLDTGTTKNVTTRVQNLTSSGQFHTKPGMPKGTGFYQDNFIQLAINSTLFSAKKKRAPIAIKYENKFRRMPLPTIAFICALIQFLIEAQAHGEATDERIVKKKISKFYKVHMKNLENIRTVDPDTIRTIRHCLFEAGASFSKVKPIAAEREDDGGGVISIADIVRARPSAGIGHEAPPAESCASEDEADKTSGTQPSDDDKGDIASKSRAQPAAAESPAWSASSKSPARPMSGRSPKRPPPTKRTTPAHSPFAPSPKRILVPVVSLPMWPRPKPKPKAPAIVEAATNEGEESSADDVEPVVSLPTRPRPKPKPKEQTPAIVEAATNDGEESNAEKPRKKTGQEVLVVSLPMRPRPKPKPKAPAVVEAATNEYKDGEESSADEGEKPCKKTGQTGHDDPDDEDEDAGEEQRGRKRNPRRASKGESSDDDEDGDFSDSQTRVAKGKGGKTGSAKRVSPQKHAGEGEGERRTSPRKKRQAESEERELFEEGSSKEAKRRKRVA
ncbi:hypothetical protein FRC10_012194 [Ceratobasidium sp. 414]|nr:hypothetical protein FRC10_012194 [Ceratobasidium sp. 414]